VRDLTSEEIALWGNVTKSIMKSHNSNHESKFNTHYVGSTISEYPRREFKHNHQRYAVLDLHGMTQFQAHRALLDFIEFQYRRGSRLVLVITGKGERSSENPTSSDERGILRRMTPLWLEHPQFRKFVSRVSSSGVRHGGDGALFVELRRPRPAKQDRP
jgi:DNA-nicking Smr family endonuclease